jgi:hypothetical protein
MKYIHRDNFRFLTGHGREACNIIDLTLEKLDIRFNYGFTSFMQMIAGDNTKTTLPVGTLVVWYLPKKRTVTTDFVGPNPGSFDLSDEIGLKMFKGLSDRGPVRNLTICTLADDDFTMSSMVSVPFDYIIKTAKSCCNGYQVYHHHYMSDYSGNRFSGLEYIGITKRGWRTRWREHCRSAMLGSHYRFHRAIREHEGSAIHRHSVVACGISEERALHLEERLVENSTLYPFGLNMVPGGNAGLAYLRRIGAIGNHERVAPDDRQDIINRFFERTSRKGLPNPLAAANWLNADYAEKVICAGEDRLKPQQIRDARFLSSLGHAADEIAAQVGARNVAQIQRLIAGETYSRII